MKWKNIIGIIAFTGVMLLIFRGTSIGFSFSDMPLWAKILGGIIAAIIVGAIIFLIAMGIGSFRGKGAHSSEGDDDDMSLAGAHHDPHHKVESRREYIAKILLLICTFGVAIVIGLAIVAGWKEIRTDDDDANLVRKTLMEQKDYHYPLVAFEVPAHSELVITGREKGKFKKDVLYKITAPSSLTIYASDGRELIVSNGIPGSDYPLRVVSQSDQSRLITFEPVGHKAN